MRQSFIQCFKFNGKIALLIEPYCPNIAQFMANQLKFDINLKYTEIMPNMIKSGKLITKDEIIPVFFYVWTANLPPIKNKTVSKS